MVCEMGLRFLLTALVLTSCVSQPPGSVDDLEPGSTKTRGDLSDSMVLSRDSTQRYARDITYRVRNPSCDGVASGSAFAISSDTLVTNKHVVEDGAQSLELSTWDGRDFTVGVSQTAIVADLAFIKTSQEIPVVAKVGEDPDVGSRVAAVGYPMGGPWTLSQGRLIERTDGSVYGVTHDVLVFDAYIAPGNSGGPLLNRSGDVVGVVFAKEVQGKEYGLAIPVSLLGSVMRNGFLETTPVAC